MEKTKHNGVYQRTENNRTRIYTKSFTSTQSRFGEVTVEENGELYREWDPTRSKLCAAIKNNLKFLPIRPGRIVLYLGAANGYTPSFVSDIIGKEGFLFAIDISPIPVRDLYFLAKERENMAAMLYDAHHPEKYEEMVLRSEVLYQDIAQRDQTRIFIKNAELLLKRGGYGVMVIKARSIDVARNPREIFREEKTRLIQAGFEILEMIDLAPYERDHMLILCKKNR